jgi:hypothetical protein
MRNVTEILKNPAPKSPYGVEGEEKRGKTLLFFMFQ